MQKQNIGRALLSLVVALGLVGSATPAHGQSLPQRSQIDAKYKWKLEDLYPTEATWEKDYAVLQNNLSRFEPFKGQLGSSGDKLARCLQLKDSLKLLSDNLSVYASLLLDEDNRNSASQERVDRINGLGSKLSGALSFIEPEILTIDSAKLEGFIANSPALATYRFYLEDLLRTRSHVLLANEEALLALAQPVTRAPYRTFSMLDDADMTYGTIKDESGTEVALSKERYYAFLDSFDRRVRHDAQTAFYMGYQKSANTLGATLSGSVKADWFYAQARKYPTCLQMSLDGRNVPVSVYHALIDATSANLEPLHKWAAIRKRVLAVDTLRPYDLYVPLIKEKPKTYTYEQAMQMVVNGLAPMGKTYLADFQKGLTSGWVDVYETEGKGSGAYQTATYSSHPYVLLNFSGTLEQVFTLAHEMGHAMNSFYANQKEPYLYCDQSLFTAEVASTCNEAVLMKYLLTQAKTKDEKLELLNYYIEQIIGTFYRQAMLAEFELTIHERAEAGEALSADYFRKVFHDVYQKYWGPDLVVDSLTDLGGLRIPHFYSAYYVYQYSTCYAAAQQLSQRMLNKEKGILDTYQRFLSTGSSKYPVDILKDAGVDMTTPEPVARTIKLFGELVDQVETLLNEP